MIYLFLHFLFQYIHFCVDARNGLAGRYGNSLNDEINRSYNLCSEFIAKNLA